MAMVNRAAEMLREESKLLEEEANAPQHQSIERSRPSTANSTATRPRDDNSSATESRPPSTPGPSTIIAIGSPMQSKPECRQSSKMKREIHSASRQGKPPPSLNILIVTITCHPSALP